MSSPTAASAAFISRIGTRFRTGDFGVGSAVFGSSSSTRSSLTNAASSSASSTSSSFGGGGGGAGGCSTGSRGGVPTRTCILRLGGGVARVRCGEVGGVGVGVGVGISVVPANRARRDRSDAAILDAADDLERICSSASLRCVRSVSGAGRRTGLGDGWTGVFLEGKKLLK